MKEESVRVRFAPSPTGELHIGGARTALFNWLFARHNRGKFILRIEDTDVLRSEKSFSQSAIENLRWLGLDWDEGPEKEGEYGPYFQSQRLGIYEKYALKLLKEERAYLCYCTLEELELRKKKMQAEGKLPKYDGRCRVLSARERKHFEEGGRASSIRFKVTQEGTTYVEDLLRGKVGFENKILGDFIILKSNKTPTFNFANVVDDTLMGITYVIRGDDHLSNTPRQILLYKALGFESPRYAHIPMILGGDGAKLSKRHGATSISYYREEGYLPWVMVNYLALLGWSTIDSQQFFEKEELVEKFSLEKVGKSAAIFDPDKLEWMNGEYIRKMKLEALTELLIPYLEKANLIEKKLNQSTRDKITQVALLEQPRIKTLSQITDLADFFFKPDFGYDPQAVKKRLKKDYVPSLLEEMRESIKQLPSTELKQMGENIKQLPSTELKQMGENIKQLLSSTELKQMGENIKQLLSSIKLKQMGENIKQLLSSIELRQIVESIEQLPSFTEKNLEETTRNLSKKLSLSTSKVFHPLRVALTGKMRGPGLFELAVVLGKNEVLRRIERALKMLKSI